VRDFSSRTFAGRRWTESAETASDEFRKQVLPHLDAAYNLARFFTRDTTLSEDVVQDAMIRAYRGFSGFRGDSPKAWLLAIVRNCCRTAVSAPKSMAGLTVHESGFSDEDSAGLRNARDPNPDPEQQAIQQDEVERVRSAIEAIPEPFREAVILRDMEDLSYGEIAEVTGAPIGTVMSRLARGRAILASALLPARDSADEQSRSAK
jgi:RNA polymerase sigma-70 factor (ECF subfamily)